jgi:hypothetical protein
MITPRERTDASCRRFGLSLAILQAPMAVAGARCSLLQRALRVLRAAAPEPRADRSSRASMARSHLLTHPSTVILASLPSPTLLASVLQTISAGGNSCDLRRNTTDIVFPGHQARRCCSVITSSTSTSTTFTKPNVVSSASVQSAPPFWKASPPRKGEMAIAMSSGNARRPISTG